MGARLSVLQPWICSTEMGVGEGGGGNFAVSIEQKTTSMPSIKYFMVIPVRKRVQKIQLVLISFLSFNPYSKIRQYLCFEALFLCLN